MTKAKEHDSFCIKDLVADILNLKRTDDNANFVTWIDGVFNETDELEVLHGSKAAEAGSSNTQLAAEPVTHVPLNEEESEQEDSDKEESPVKGMYIWLGKMCPNDAFSSHTWSKTRIQASQGHLHERHCDGYWVV